VNFPTHEQYYAASQEERDAMSATHREGMTNPEYAAAYAKHVAQRQRPPMSRRRAGEFETPIGPPALKTSAQLTKEHAQRREAEGKKK
jgi:hypothetical protein